jgi:hypothetical protein
VDNWFQGRQRAVWFSVNNDLLESTRRDLNDLGVKIPLAKINDYDVSGDITLPCGVIFSSYSSLISTSRSGAKRFDQLHRWLGPEAVVIFDEAHKAKNALASGGGEPTQTGQAVIDLQNPKQNFDYRVVYSSATGATDVRNMAYMTRLGLWGPGTNFPQGFTQFLSEIDGGGVGAMEMVSRDMKSLGMYLSGSISFGVDPTSGKAVEYRERVHPLTEEQRKIYNNAARAWQVVLQNVGAALEITNSGGRAKGIALQKFWGDHQRFFRQLICAFKVPAVLEEAETALAQGKSVVISLVGTGEAKTKEQISRVTAEGGVLEDLDFSPREIIAAMVERGFPTAVYLDTTDAATGRTVKVLATDPETGEPIQSQEALKLRQKLLDGLSTLHLPENSLDQIVNHFGERNVAEITGRAKRLVRDSITGRVEYKKRAPEGVPMIRVNIDSMERFQAGVCRVSIISDAGSIGISLHSSNRAKNRERRVHITLELGWSADKQMQCFGRTHRSDQAVPPEYVLLSTELGGEKRFSSTIARRLQSLGALTKGDRGAADNADWQRYNFETHEGSSALCLMYKRIVAGETVKGLKDPKQTLRDIGLLVTNAEGTEEVRKDDQFNVPRFLNRVLALQVDEQNALFDYFADLFDQTVRYAKANGTYDEGVTDIRALAIRVGKPPVLVHTDKVTGAETILYTLEVDRPSDTVSFDRADRLRLNNKGAFAVHRKKGEYILVLPSGRHTNTDGSTYQTYSVWKPEAARYTYLSDNDLNERYRVVSANAAQQWWQARFSQAPTVDTSNVHIIAGAIIPLWHKLKTDESDQLSVVRVSTKDGHRIVGAEIPKTGIGKVLRSLGIGNPCDTPEQVFTSVLTQGDEIELACNMKLKRTLLQREPVIELVCHDSDRFGELRRLGLINEQIRYKQRFFVSTDEKLGLPILTKLLDVYPMVGGESDEQDSAPILDAATASEFKTVCLEEWILPPETAFMSGSVPEPQMPPLLLPEVVVLEGQVQQGPSMASLIAQYSNESHAPRPRRNRPKIEQQGVLFTFQ